MNNMIYSEFLEREVEKEIMKDGKKFVWNEEHSMYINDEKDSEGYKEVAFVIKGKIITKKWNPLRIYKNYI